MTIHPLHLDLTPLMKRVLVAALSNDDALTPPRCNKNTRDALIRRCLVDKVDGAWTLTAEGYEAARWLT